MNGLGLPRIQVKVIYKSNHNRGVDVKKSLFFIHREILITVFFFVAQDIC